MKIHHIGYLVRDIEKARIQFYSFGFSDSAKPVYDAQRGIDILFMENDGYRIELVAPKHEGADMWNQLKKRGATPYHICYIAEDLDAAIKSMEEMAGGGVQAFVTTITGSRNWEPPGCVSLWGGFRNRGACGRPVMQLGRIPQ